MFEWLKRKAAKPLSGAPPVRRRKSYSAASGYVYEYHFEGYRDVSHGREPGREYVFDVSADRTTSFPAAVFLPDSVAAAWESGRRPLQPNERYAIAKMALFQAFDERPEPGLMKKEILLRPADVCAILETLGID